MEGLSPRSTASAESAFKSNPKTECAGAEMARQDWLRKEGTAEILREMVRNADQLEEDSPEQLAAITLDMATLQDTLRRQAEDVSVKVWMEAVQWILEEW